MKNATDNLIVIVTLFTFSLLGLCMICFPIEIVHDGARYLVDARTFARGGDYLYIDAQLPPFYPVMISLFIRMHFSEILSVKILHGILWLGLLISWLFILKKIVLSRLFLAGFLLLVSSFAVWFSITYIYSEILYFALLGLNGCLIYWYAKSQEDQKALLIMALACNTVCLSLTRFAGVVVMVSNICLLGVTLKPEQRIKYIVSYAIISLSGVIWFLFRNLYLAGEASDYFGYISSIPGFSHSEFWGNFFLRAWGIPKDMWPMGMGLVVIFTVTCGYIIQRKRITCFNGYSNEARVLLLGVFLNFIFYSATLYFMNAFSLWPAYKRYFYPLALLGPTLLCFVWEFWERNRDIFDRNLFAVMRGLFVAVFFWGIFSNSMESWAYGQKVSQYKNSQLKGVRFLPFDKAEEAMQWLILHKSDDHIVYSNFAQYVSLLADVPAEFLSKDINRFQKQLTNIRAKRKEIKDVYLVIDKKTFRKDGYFPWRKYLTLPHRVRWENDNAIIMELIL